MLIDTHTHTDVYLTLEIGGKGKEKQTNCGAEVIEERRREGREEVCGELVCEQFINHSIPNRIWWTSFPSLTLCIHFNNYVSF